ncbi:MAG: cytochrome c3 family protein [Steroidobacteraceae bacterium]
MKNFISMVSRSRMSLLGSVFATAALVLFVVMFLMQLLGFEGGPYIGIITYLALPGLFLLGLLLIVMGLWRAKKRQARGEAEPPLPVIDFNKGATRKTLATFGILGLVSVVLLSVGSFKAVHWMESVEFCGTTCHTVMQPEYTAYQRSPHSRVACADCHIGPGADWFVKSKISGSWQLIAVTFDLYPTPIPTPVHNLRPARETCEQCHNPTKFSGDRLKVRAHFADDEKNTEMHNVLLVKVGGQHGRGSSGIHWHVDPNVSIRYLTDEKLETVWDVEMTKNGEKTVFEAKDAAPSTAQWRTMDCVDCHNRPTHIYRMPAGEIDAAMEQGLIDKGLPFVKREGLRVVQADYPSHEAARAGIAREIAGFYAQNYPDAPKAAVEQAGRALGDIYSWNIFPAMKVTWGAYPNHIGHKESPGCFRCHDRKHKAESGAKISKDCDTCHTVLAEDEEDPAILRQIAGEEPEQAASAAGGAASATTTQASASTAAPTG